MNATTQPATAIVMAEKFVDWAISSQAGQEWAEGSTTSGFSPDRMKPPRVRGDMSYLRKITGIYHILHDATQSGYVGASRDVMRRFAEHKSDMRYGRHANAYLQDLYDEHGMDSFRFVAVEECDACDLKRREQAHMDEAVFWVLNIYAASENSDAAGPSVSAGLKRRYALDDDLRARNASHLAIVRAGDAFKAAHQSDEANRKRAEATREHWQDPALAADRIERIKAGMERGRTLPGTCGNCGAAFVGSKAQRWCSPNCRMAGFYAGKSKPRAQPSVQKVYSTPMTCGNCGDSFVGRSGRKWCSSQCRVAAFKAKAKQKAC